VPIPPNIDTVNTLFGTSLDTEEDMVAWLDKRRPKLDRPPANGEEMSISRSAYSGLPLCALLT
jgi:UDP-galactopyranose mutase